jgi:heme oxygenase
MTEDSGRHTAVALSARLKTETAELHNKLDKLVMSSQPFADRDRYGRFVVAQFGFQRDIETLYDDAQLLAMIPDLRSRPRLAAAAADLDFLGVALPAADGGPVAAPEAVPEALGWLYVSEGSKLGAAFLLKEAGEQLGVTETDGARNLASPEGGRGAAWKRFVQVLDTCGLSGSEQDRVVAGARAAFDRFEQLLVRSYAASQDQHTRA